MPQKEPFFVRDREFYTSLLALAVSVTVQNLVAYSVNMLDNIMLGSYSQNSLAGAAAVNQIFFMVQQTAISMGNALVVIASQYWGSGNTEPVRRLSFIVLRICFAIGILTALCCGIFPEQIMMIFTGSEEILREGLAYLGLIKWTFVMFVISTVLMAMLRSVETVRISMVVSVISLIINAGINYTLIFGRFGFPELGIRGAAIGTLISRSVELVIVICYVALADKKICFFSQFSSRMDTAISDRELKDSYIRVAIPMVSAVLIWSMSVPLQTAILGHLSDDALAANSVSSTFYQYIKVIITSLSASAAVIIGKDIGKGDMARVRADGRTLSVMAPSIGLILAVVMAVARTPLLSLYSLSAEALVMADHFITIMSVALIFMAYQMPVASGILQGAGDVSFCMKLNMVSTWCIVMPLSFAAAFWWKLPAELVVLAILSDQFFKCIPVYLRFRSYKWIHVLTRQEQP